MISSAAGMGWENSLDELHEYLDLTDFDDATKWAQDHLHADYMWSKKAINAYVAREATAFSRRASASTRSCRGRPTRRLAQANKEMWLGFGSDYREDVGIDASTPLEQAYPLVFFCSDAAGHHRYHDDHRRRLLRRRRHGLVPARTGGDRLPAQHLMCTA